MLASESRTLFERLGYPHTWLDDAARYTQDDAYLAFDPRWVGEVPDVPRATVDTIISGHAATRPDDPALINLGRTITYGEFEKHIARTAGVLREHGVGRGDIVAVMLPTMAMHWIVFFAAARLGATHCGVNVMYTPRELDYLFTDCTPTALVVLDQFLPVVEEAASAHTPRTVLRVSLHDLAAPGFEPYPPLAPLWNAEAPRSGPPRLLDLMAEATPVTEGAEVDLMTGVGQIVYTAGTTGDPKGVMESHYNLMHNAVAHIFAMPGVTTKPVNYSVLPMFHTGGFFLYSMPTFYLGGVVIPRPLFDPGDALATIEKEKVDALFGPPTMYVGLMAYGLEGRDLSSLQACITGAAPIPAELPAKWRRATGRTVHAGWGMSELNTLGCFTGLVNKPQTQGIGLPVMGEVRIVADGAVAARGTVGEIEFRGMQVARGYAHKPEQTAEAFQRDGWFRTGDVGLIDEQDHLHYVDRAKDLIFASGYNIAPMEIEQVILGDPRVVEVAVVGEPQGYRGEVPVAFVVGGLTEEEILQRCRENLAKNKIPARIVIVDELPKNAIGKTLKRELRRRLEN
ncbi:class I adenylate-forming enzyme family protein [Tomitella fengzijianii]|uniref:class I adenylate-forming enzyme family protein n=1 Tax=Tomitella fengzijianii TaxID=2597660 RepID=UPI00131B7E37|nr:AMP-binding protein [Tomitella fengzijianii]